jgi:hypothetical protein
MADEISVNELTSLMGHVVKLVADVAKADKDEVGGLSTKLDELTTELNTILDNIEDIRNQTVPKREQWPLEGLNREQIYQQCIEIVDKKLKKHLATDYIEYGYVRMSVLGKDEYGNITDGELEMKISIYLVNMLAEATVTLDIVDSYILEPMYVTYNHVKHSFDSMINELDEMQSYLNDYNTRKEEVPNWLEMRSLNNGRSADEWGQKEYPTFNNDENSHAYTPVSERKMVSN